MKKTHPKGPELLEEYDFSAGVRGKYASRYAEGTNVVVLDPDVAELFSDSEAVNRALRAIGGIITEHSQKRSRRSGQSRVKTP